MLMYRLTGSIGIVGVRWLIGLFMKCYSLAFSMLILGWCYKGYDVVLYGVLCSILLSLLF